MRGDTGRVFRERDRRLCQLLLRTRYHDTMNSNEESTGAAEIAGYVCPFCGTDCSPIAPTPLCAHYFLTDGENGWRFTATSRALFEAAKEKQPTLFRDLLYHDAICRQNLRLRRANYDDSLEMYAFTSNPEQTAGAFTAAIAQA